MPLHWFSVVVDCDDPDRLAEFWCQVLDYEVVYRTKDIVDIAKDTATFPGIEFIRADRDERRKSPLHLDLNPENQAAEVDRLLALGAQRINIGEGPDAAWVVLADPEGNAFCVLSPQQGWDAPT
jgi:catechol 2,3-dioxygenase-like lactoylglutathione lyase family enzyme